MAPEAEIFIDKVEAFHTNIRRIGELWAGSSLGREAVYRIENGGFVGFRIHPNGRIAKIACGPSEALVLEEAGIVSFPAIK